MRELLHSRPFDAWADRLVYVYFKQPDVRILSVSNAKQAYGSEQVKLRSAGSMISFHMLNEKPPPHCTPGGKGEDGNDLPPSCRPLASRAFNFQMAPPSDVTRIVCHQSPPPMPPPPPPPPPSPPSPSPPPPPPPPPSVTVIRGCRSLSGRAEAHGATHSKDGDRMTVYVYPDTWPSGATVALAFAGRDILVSPASGEVRPVRGETDSRCTGYVGLLSTNVYSSIFCFRLVGVPNAFGAPKQFSFDVRSRFRASLTAATCWDAPDWTGPTMEQLPAQVSALQPVPQTKPNDALDHPPATPASVARPAGMRDSPTPASVSSATSSVLLVAVMALLLAPFALRAADKVASASGFADEMTAADRLRLAIRAAKSEVGIRLRGLRNSARSASGAAVRRCGDIDAMSSGHPDVAASQVATDDAASSDADESLDESSDSLSDKAAASDEEAVSPSDDESEQSGDGLVPTQVRSHSDMD